MKYWCLATTIFLTGCVVTDVGNPQDNVEEDEATIVDFQAYESSIPNALVLDSGIEVTNAWIVIDEAEAETCEIEGTEQIEVDYEGPIAVDLISGESFPRGLNLSGAMRFCELQIKVDSTTETLPPQAPPELVGQSILVRAERADGVTVEILQNFELELRLRGEVEIQSMRRLIVGFAANEWFSTDLVNAEAEDGVLRVDDDTNVELGEEFQERFRRSSGLFEDEDRDGEFDDDEEDEIAEIED